MTKCPKCEGSISHVKIQALDGTVGMQSWKCLSYNCPHCNTSLGVQIDPIAVKTDTIKELKR